jgi:hypothetical protein
MAKPKTQGEGRRKVDMRKQVNRTGITYCVCKKCNKRYVDYDIHFSSVERDTSCLYCHHDKCMEFRVKNGIHCPKCKDVYEGTSDLEFPNCCKEVQK